MSVKHAMKRNEHYMLNRGSSELGLVADPVIEAIARLEFEDSLRTGVLHGGCLGPYSDRT